MSRRIGIAFTKPVGDRNRRNEYGIFDDGTCIYEGYRFTESDGTETQVGLPLAGPGSKQLYGQFFANSFDVVRYFGKKEAHGQTQIPVKEEDHAQPIRKADQRSTYGTGSGNPVSMPVQVLQAYPVYSISEAPPSESGRGNTDVPQLSEVEHLPKR